MLQILTLVESLLRLAQTECLIYISNSQVPSTDCILIEVSEVFFDGD